MGRLFNLSVGMFGPKVNHGQKCRKVRNQDIVKRNIHICAHMRCSDANFFF